jgi:hypothetical protein
VKKETVFRIGKVDPFLKRLPNTYSFSVQQISLVGDPDKVLCINGRFVALELKSEEGKPSKLQTHKLNKVTKAGGIAIVVWPHNWNKVKDRLLKYSQGDFSDQDEA